MIVAETADAYRLVTQPDHAALAGQFADRWGAEPFESLTPSPAVALAAHHHDAGWTAYDRRPRRSEDGSPRTFTEVPAAEWTELYERGIDAVADLDAYAGLLVSMHGSGLRRRRYGLSPTWPDTPEAFRAFVEREEARQTRLAERLRADGALSDADRSLLATLHETGSYPDGTTSRLWHNYALLQAWDSLSLLLCLQADPPAEDAVESVPTRPGEDVTLTLRSSADGSVTLDPYPFDASPIRVTVPARRIPNRAYEREDALIDAYYAAPRETLAFDLRPPA